MNFTLRVKRFLHRNKRVLFTTSMLMLVVVMVFAVALASNNSRAIYDNDAVNTSTPSKITFVMPIKNGVIIKDFSNTSLKYNSTLKQWESHKGVDIKGADDAEVMAGYDGEVVSVENNYLCGTIITIRHSDNLQSVYSSLDEAVSVKVGDKVKAGQVIGKVSTSAKSESADGAHLHFEVLLNNVKTDPALYLETDNK